jgi:hypothetical protein
LFAGQGTPLPPAATKQSMSARPLATGSLTTAKRTPQCVALAAAFQCHIIRAASMMPNTNRKNSSTTSANSTLLVPFLSVITLCMMS